MRCSFIQQTAFKCLLCARHSWNDRVTKSQSPSLGSSPCSEEDTYSFIQLVNYHPFARVSRSPFCAGLWDMGLGTRQGARGRGLSVVPRDLCLSQVCLPTSCRLASVSPSGCQGVAQAGPQVPDTHQHSRFLSQDGQMLSDTPVPAPSPRVHSGLGHRPAQSSLAATQPLPHVTGS